MTTIPKYEEKLRRWARLLLDEPEYHVAYDQIGSPAAALELLEANSATGASKLDPMVPLQHLRAATTAGVFPHIKVLAYFAERIGAYIEAGGTLTLDEAFRLVSRQRAGNPSKQLRTRQERNEYCYAMFEYQRDNPAASDAQAGERVAERLNLEKPYADTMVKYYREWRQRVQAAFQDEERRE